MRWCHGLLVAQICPAGRAEFCRTISVWTFMPNCLYHVVLPDSPNSEAIGVFTSKYSMSGLFAFWSGHVGAVAGCRCRVPLPGEALRVLLLEWCALWSWPAGAAAGCCCQSAVCLGAGTVPGRRCCGTWVLVPLHGVARCLWQCWAVGPD